jgi:hypothetical protein
MDKLSPFDVINAINSKTKTDLDTTQYNPFIVNRGLSFFKDTVLYANEVNSRSHLDKDMQYSFLLNTITKAKRFSKWAKQDPASTELELVMTYYKVNRTRALEILDILTSDQLKTIEEKCNVGGRK